MVGVLITVDVFVIVGVLVNVDVFVIVGVFETNHSVPVAAFLEHGWFPWFRQAGLPVPDSSNPINILISSPRHLPTHPISIPVLRLNHRIAR